MGELVYLYSMSKALNKIKQLLNQPGLSLNDIICLMSQIRILIEENNLAAKYKYLNLYCNWILHSKISKSLLCFSILEQLTDILVKHHAIENDIIHEVSNIISIPGLRKDFIDFFNSSGLPNNIFSDRETWKGIFSLIASNLIDKPLCFPEMKVINGNPKIKAIYDSTQNKSKNTDLAVKNFSFILLDSTFFWKIQTSKEFVDIISPLIFLE
ncbi:MAG: hypothetical protein WC624_02780 [Candidatus Margulisiibacteriota bacterium]